MQSISIGTTAYVSEVDFFRYNPWFRSTIKERIIESNAMRTKIREEMVDYFPVLWNRQMNGDPAWLALKSRLGSEVENGEVRIRSASQFGVDKVNSATEQKVGELMNSPQFETLKSTAFNAVMSKYNVLHSKMETDNLRTEQERESRLQLAEGRRNQRLVEVEQMAKSTRNSQLFTFLGGSAVGAGLMFLFRPTSQ